MNRKTTAFRLSPEERKFLARHGRALVDQLRRDLAEARGLKRYLETGRGVLSVEVLDAKGKIVEEES